MFSINRGNKYLFSALNVFIFGSLFVEIISKFTGKEIGVLPNIILSQWVLLFIPIAVYFFITRSSLKKTCNLNKISFVNILLCIILAIFLIPFISLINLISQLFVKNYIGTTMLEAAKYPYWILLFLIAVTPAILEEISMRGIMLSNYSNKKVTTICLMNGLFFGIFHMNINQFMYAFVLGAIFALVVLITRSILSSMIMHFVINGLMVTLLKLLVFLNSYLAKTNPEMVVDLMNTNVNTNEILMMIPIFIIICLFTAPIVGLILYGLIKYNKQDNIFKKTGKEALGYTSNNLNNNDLLIVDSSDKYAKIKVFFENNNEKIVTPYLTLSLGMFIIFVILAEFVFV